MPSLKSLRLRIKSVKNTRQITKTMKMVAAAKVRKARMAVEAARPYAAHLQELLATLAGQVGGSAPALLTGRAQVRTVRLIVVGTDRGLCGALNANLIKAAHRFIEGQQQLGRTVQLVAVGRKVYTALRRSHPALMAGHTVDYSRHVSPTLAADLAAAARTAFEDKQVDEVHTLCAHCASMLTQQPLVQQVIPFGLSIPNPTQAQAVAEYEPDEATVLATLLPLNLNQQMFTALLETAASEHAARMTAMDSATRNAGDMIKKLGIQYNRSRQAAITKELIEIISGAQAV